MFLCWQLWWSQSEHACVCDDVLLEIGHSGESLAAVGAGEWAFAGVYQMVRSQSLGIGEASIALLAYKWLFSGVRAHVAGHLAPLIEALPALGADVRSFSRVRPEMVLVVTLGDESLSALLTLEGFVAFLAKLVVFDVSLGFELLVADVALVHGRLARQYCDVCVNDDGTPLLLFLRYWLVVPARSGFLICFVVVFGVIIIIFGVAVLLLFLFLGFFALNWLWRRCSDVQCWSAIFSWFPGGMYFARESGWRRRRRRKKSEGIRRYLHLHFRRWTVMSRLAFLLDFASCEQRSEPRSAGDCRRWTQALRRWSCWLVAESGASWGGWTLCDIRWASTTRNLDAFSTSVWPPVPRPSLVRAAGGLGRWWGWRWGAYLSWHLLELRSCDQASAGLGAGVVSVVVVVVLLAETHEWLAKLGFLVDNWGVALAVSNGEVWQADEPCVHERGWGKFSHGLEVDRGMVTITLHPAADHRRGKS